MFQELGAFAVPELFEDGLEIDLQAFQSPGLSFWQTSTQLFEY